MNGRLVACVDGWVGRWMYGWMGGFKDGGFLYRGVYVWVRGWTGAYVIGSMDEWMASINVWMDECMGGRVGVWMGK